MASKPNTPDVTDEPFLITKSSAGNQFKAQLRLVVAAVAGSLVTAAAAKLNIPLITTLWGQQGDQIVGAITGVILLGAMSAWQAVRTYVQNHRWWQLATDKRVPNSVVAPHPSEIVKGNV